MRKWSSSSALRSSSTLFVAGIIVLVVVVLAIGQIVHRTECQGSPAGATWSIDFTSYDVPGVCADQTLLQYVLDGGPKGLVPPAAP